MGIGAAIASLFFTYGTTAYYVTAAVVNVAVAVGTSLLSQALVDTPSGQAPQKDPGRKGNIRSTTEPHHIVFGHVRKGGVIAYLNGTGEDNEFLHRVVVFAAHEIDEFLGWYYDGEEITLASDGTPTDELADNVRLLSLTGADDQAAMAELIAENTNWTADHRLRGRAYAYDRLKYDPEVFPSFIPSLTAELQGKADIFDPRDDSTGYSRNPALIVAHILETYLDVPRERIDETTLIASANECDEATDELSGATPPRYAADGWFLLEGEPGDWLRGPLLAMAGALVEHGGIYYIEAGKWNASVATITDDDIVGAIRFKTARSDSERSNVATGTFVGAAGYDQPAEFPPYKLASAITEDGGIERPMNLDLEWISNPAQAQRVAKILLMENRLDETIEVEVTFAAGKDLRPFQTVTFDSDAMGITGTFRVKDHDIQATEAGLVVKLTLKEHAEAVYAWDHETEEQEFASPAGDTWRDDQVTIATYSVTGNTTEVDHNPGEIDITWSWDHSRTLVNVEFEAIITYEFREDSGDPWEAREIEVTDTVAAGSSPTNLQFEDAGEPGGDFQNVAFKQLRARADFGGGEFGSWLTLNAETLSLGPQLYNYPLGTSGAAILDARKNPSSPAGTVVRYEFGSSAVVDDSSPSFVDAQNSIGTKIIGTKVKMRAWEPGKQPSSTRTWTVGSPYNVWRD